MNSLRECVTCKDIKDTTYLLPCLHPTCSQCVEEIVQDAKQKKRKLPGCRECGEPFVQDKLTTVPSNNNSTSECAECGANATHYCRDCNEHLCKLHGDGHPTTRRAKGHVVQLVVELPFCHKHATETAGGFCSNCKLLVCTNCIVNEHNKSPHLTVSLQEAAKATSDSVKKDVAKLLESVPAIDKEIKNHTDTRTKLEKERADLEAKIVDIRKQEKVTTLQIEDLEKTKTLLLTTQTQANALASTATTLSHSTLLRLQSVITTRVSNLQAGLGLISGLVSVAPSTKTPGLGLMSGLVSVAPSTKTLPVTIFNRIFTQNITVSNNGKTITKKAPASSSLLDQLNATGWGYGISDDGCSSGVRSWRIIINSINSSSYKIVFGIWNSANAPASGDSWTEANAWLVYCSTGGTASAYKAGSCTGSNSTSPLQSGDVILLTADADQRRLTVQNTTRGWTYTINQLPPPNPAFYPHVLLYDQNQSVTIEAAS